MKEKLWNCILFIFTLGTSIGFLGEIIGIPTSIIIGLIVFGTVIILREKQK